MAEETATLRDVTSEPNPSITEAKEPAQTAAPAEPDAAQIAAEAAMKVADAEALEIGRTLRDSGFTKDQINVLLEAPQALNSLRAMIKNNPQEFIRSLERADPGTAERFHEKVVDEYIDRYGDKGADAKVGNGRAIEAPPELMQEVQRLRSKLDNIEREGEQAKIRAAVAQVQTRYEARVDDLFGQLPKELGLTRAETKALRAQLNQELAADQNIVARVNNGNFADVPRHFQGIIEGWAGDRKAAAETAKAARDGVTRRSNATVIEGANPLMVELPKVKPELGWDDMSDFVEALKQTAGM